jgi:hypothetical protein
MVAKFNMAARKNKLVSTPMDQPTSDMEIPLRLAKGGSGSPGVRDRRRGFDPWIDGNDLKFIISLGIIDQK